MINIRKLRLIAIILVCTMTLNACSSPETANTISETQSTTVSENTNTVENNTVESSKTEASSSSIRNTINKNTNTPTNTKTKTPTPTIKPTSTPIPTPINTIDNTEEYINEADALYMKSSIISVTDKPYTYLGYNGYYSGDWKSDRPEGNGVFYYDEYGNSSDLITGFYCSGEWTYGYINGQAQLLWYDQINKTNTFCEGQCIYDSLVGEGYTNITHEDGTLITVRGDYSDESTMRYYTFDENHFCIDIGTIVDGYLYSFLDNLDSAITQKWSMRLENISMPKSTTIGLIKNIENTITSGTYYGYIQNGKPAEYGYFLPDDMNIDTIEERQGKSIPITRFGGYIGLWRDGKFVDNFNYTCYKSGVAKDDINSSINFGFKVYNKYNEDGNLIQRTIYNDFYETYDIDNYYYNDFTLGDDGIYRGFTREVERYYKNGGKDYYFPEADIYYSYNKETKCTYDPTKYSEEELNKWYGDFSESIYAAYLKNGDPYYYEEGLGDRVRIYVENGQKVSNSNNNNTTNNDINNNNKENLTNTILTLGGIAIGLYASYKLLTSSSRGKSKEVEDSMLSGVREEIRKNEAQTKANREKAKQLREEAEALERKLKYGTLSEYEVNQLNKQIAEKYKEARNYDPSIF